MATRWRRLNRHADNDFELLKKYKNLNTSEDFIRKHWKKGIGDKTISYRGNLSNRFIEDYKEWLDWHGLCICQKFTEEDLEKYSKYLDWFCVAMYQSLSPQFVNRHKEEFKENLGSYAVEDNRILTNEEKNAIIKILNN